MSAKRGRYAAFLRGINVGGNAIIPMEKLRKSFETLHLTNVRTLLASGNVLFEAPPAATSVLERKIQGGLAKSLGREIPVIVRTLEELEHLARSDPFGGIRVTPKTRLYVTFLSENPGPAIKTQYAAPGGYFRILRVSDREVCSVLTLSPGYGTVQLMKVLEERFGRSVTTRNWRTVVRIVKTPC